jgi:hypothetical protein
VALVTDLDVMQLVQQQLSGGPSLQESIGRLAQSDPDLAPLAQLLAQREEQLQRDLERDEQASQVEQQEAEQAEARQRRASALREHLDGITAELGALRARLDDVAGALGACPACFGDDRGCHWCHGRGGPGSMPPRLQRVRPDGHARAAAARAPERATQHRGGRRCHPGEERLMNGYSDDLDSLLDSLEYEEFEEYDEAAPRRRATVRTPTRQSSFVPRQTATPASQTQVQSAARNLDSKIETLSSAVQALETRTNSLSAAQGRQVGLLRKEVADRRKSTDATRSDLQQTKMLALLLPLLTQETTDATDDSGRTVKVVTQSQNQLATLLPLLLLMPGYSGGDGKGGFGGGDSTMLLLLVLLLGRK